MHSEVHVLLFILALICSCFPKRYYVIFYNKVFVLLFIIEILRLSVSCGLSALRDSKMHTLFTTAILKILHGCNGTHPTKDRAYCTVCTLYTKQCALQSTHYILNTAHSTGCSLPRDSRITDASISGSCFRPCMWRGHCTLYTVQCTLYSVHCILYTIKSTLNSELCTVNALNFTQTVHTDN